MMHREGLSVASFEEIDCGEIVMWLGELSSSPIFFRRWSILYEERILHLTESSLKNLNIHLVPASPKTVTKYRK